MLPAFYIGRKNKHHVKEKQTEKKNLSDLFEPIMKFTEEERKKHQHSPN